MFVYNTLSRKKEEFKPLNPPNVNIYVCGPTVYDYFHIGNARSFIMADMIRRYLEYKSYKVKFVMNITDIDDKIIKKSNAEHKKASEIAENYSSAFYEDIEKLKIKRADINPKATMHMDDIIREIKELVDKGYAYNKNGDVYYDVKKFPAYGKLSGKKIDELESGSRVEINEQKHNPLDFTLWKKAKEGEPYWESPWGIGRPGWHIECSAMSAKYLDTPIDIHAGGSDLIFPHHENEIAQSEAVLGKEFVKTWIHFGFLNINNEKMSKSLGNFFTAREVLKKFSAETIRLFFAQTHYAGPLSFSEELLASAGKGLEKITNLAHKLIELSSSTGGVNPEFNFEKYYKDFEASMDDDFNSPQAIAVIFDFVRDFNRALADNPDVSALFINSGKEFLEKTAQAVLGIVDFKSLKNIENNESLTDELINILIDLRNTAKNEKNYKMSDKIRDELKNAGVLLQDQKEKTSYKIVKKDKQE